MTSTAASELASTLQFGSIRRHPSPSHDINPSTTASSKEPVTLSEPSHDRTPSTTSDVVPLSALRPIPRRSTLPPLPDLRFEQSYLKSLQEAETGWGVAWITIRDQVFLPLFQGTLWALILSGWRHWHQTTSFSGRTVGAKMRRWWWGVNDWKIPNR
ncbi:DUF1770-domain-containing protein [Eremomyces bilateralis CBS 781.70]|uniref:DUF1770-domain-containing protein n=1 Tax=Eremomyces bilateralis CBS 781.70 TaxID=1392243 RepID=A0A6G1G1B4_9PEZI|nr:DUF1770-domain-containing protein [Eremomyces bilateralis CBS 781.70]KAF1811721.1 DUF1770-domain-containing protein [Eremomyces bilateralis CBS 781.70]